MKIDLINTNFDLLGITFSINLHAILKLNYKSNVLEIEQAIKQWKSRKLTPIGRIVVLKNFNFIQTESFDLTLPNIDHDFYKSLTKHYSIIVTSSGQIYTNFRKIQLFKTTVREDKKMIDYKEFLCALNSTWIKTLFYSSPK